MQRYRNWGLMITGIYLTPVIWLSLLVAVFFGATSFLYTPIYEATTILSLDSALSKILKNLKTPVPTTESSSFIRVEYFATSTLETISYPEIAEVVINDLNITDKNGNKISPPELLSSSLWGLSLFSSSKKAINIEWVADTQQFSITGYAKDLDSAATLSSSYARAFLTHNSNEFSSSFASILERLEINKGQREKELIEINQKIIAIQQANSAYDIDNSVDLLTQTIQAIEAEIDELNYSESIYQIKFNHLSSQLDDISQLKTFEKRVQKNPEVTALLANIRTLLIDLAQIASTKTVNHPSYIVTQDKIKKTQELLDKETATILSEVTQQLPPSYSTISTTLIELITQHLVNDIKNNHKKHQINKYQERLNILSKISQDINYLRQTRDSIYSALNTIASDVYSINDVKNNNLPSLRVVSSTNPKSTAESSQKVFPKRKSLVILAFIATFAILGFLIFLSEIITDKLYVGWQLPLAQQRSFAEIPFYPSLPNTQANTSAICRYLRGIFIADPENSIFRVSSLASSTGQEAIALSLANYIGRFEDSVVVFDCDTSSGRLTHHLKLTDQLGIKDILRGDIEISADLIQPHPQLKIGIIPVGTGTVLHCGKDEIARFHQLLDYCSNHTIKTILLDPPIDNDELLLTESCTGAHSLLVVQSGSVTIEQIEAMQSQSASQQIEQTKMDAIVLTTTPYMADILTLKGILNFIVHFIKSPIQLLKSGWRGHAS